MVPEELGGVMEVDLALVSEGIQKALIAILEAIVEGVDTLAGVIPNPDVFPAMLSEADFTGDEAAVLAFRWVNEFVDVEHVSGVIVVWLSMFALAWVIMMLWRWAKAVR